MGTEKIDPPRELDPHNPKDAHLIQRLTFAVGTIGATMKLCDLTRAEGMTALAIFFAEQTPDEMLEDVLKIFCDSVRLNSAAIGMPEKGKLS